MILVTVGMTRFSFQRLLNLSKQLAEKYPKKKIVVQGGSGRLKSKDNLSVKDFLTYDELVELIKKAELVISHGGPATIYLCLKYGKRPLIMPRKKKFNEHINDHQVYFTKFLKKRGLVKEIFNFKNVSLRSKRLKYKNIQLKNNLLKKLMEYTDSL